MNLGDRIKNRRKELGMTVDDLAKIVGKSRATIYRYENGAIEKLPTDVLVPFADALDTTPDYLMGWTEDSKRDRFHLTFHRKTIDSAIEKAAIEEIERIISNSNFDALELIGKFSQLDYEKRKEVLAFIDFKLSQM